MLLQKLCTCYEKCLNLLNLTVKYLYLERSFHKLSPAGYTIPQTLSQSEGTNKRIMHFRRTFASSNNDHPPVCHLRNLKR